MTEDPFTDGLGQAAVSDSPLEAAAKLRIPKFDPDGGKAALVDRLMDFTLESAYVRADVFELRLAAQRQLAADAEEWRKLAGYEIGQTIRTQKDREEAKRRHRPDLAERIDQAKWTIERCTEAIDRLDKDAASASRAYTLLSGS